MSVKKRFLKTRPVCKVRFKIPKEVGRQYETAHVVGDFNDWDPNATPMDKLKSGAFSLALDLELDQRHEFRYLLDGEEWRNEEQADEFVPGPYPGVQNSVIVA